MNIQHLILLSVSASLVACGGGGGGSNNSTPAPSPTTRSVSGTAIDGYIKGATAFLDLNYNGQLDSGEPSNITDTEGNYRLAITGNNADCVDYAPIVVNVPVGAIDADHPDTPISEAYQLVYPPVKAINDNATIKSTTPLTTVLWNQIQQDIHKQSLNSCQALKQAINSQNQIVQNIKEQELRIAQRYNIDVSDLYGDFVKSQSAELYQLAQNLMPAIKRSYEETKQLQLAYPTAQRAYVDYYWEYWDYTAKQTVDKWYRKETVLYANKLSSITQQVSADLDNPLQLKERIERNTKQVDGLTYSKEAWLYLGTTSGTYRCLIDETFAQQPQANALTIYGIANRSFTDATEDSWQECVNNNVGNDYSQQLYTAIYDNERDQMLLSKGNYYYQKNPKYPDLVNLQDRLDSYQRGDLDVLSTLSAALSNTQDHGADSWSREKYQYIKNGTNDYTGILTMRYSSGLWTQEHFYQNGTRTYQCSDDGSSWSAENCPKE